MFTCIFATHRDSTTTDCPLRRTEQGRSKERPSIQSHIKSKVETVTADRVKPAHIKRKPENDSTQQHKATTKSKPTASKPTAKTREPRTSVARARSTTMWKPSRTGVTTEKNSNARSATQTKEAVPAITQRSDTTME